MDELKKLFAEEAQAAGIHDPAMHDSLFAEFTQDMANQRNQSRLSSGPLQPGQGARIDKLSAAGAEQPEASLGGVAGAMGSSVMDMLAKTGQGLANNKLDLKQFAPGAPPTDFAGPINSLNPLKQFAGGLQNEVQQAQKGIPSTNQDVGNTVMGGLMTGAAGLGAMRGQSSPTARAVKLVNDLKPSAVSERGIGPTQPADAARMEEFVQQKDPFQGQDKTPVRGTLQPAFEEDALPRGMQPPPAPQAYPPTGVHPELQALYDEVLTPAKGGAPEEGAGFQAAASASAKRAGKSGVRRSERYRNTFDSSGEGQPE